MAPWEANQEPVPSELGDQADQQQVEDAAGQLARITWALLLDQWTAACEDT